MTGPAAGERAIRGTPLQRARAALLEALGAILGHLPQGAADGLSDALGELWYRAAPGRAARARGNLAQVAGWLAAEGRGSARARAAAADPAALERLVRLAFHHGVRTYVETLRGRAAVDDARRGLVVETPAAVATALASAGPMLLVTAHHGSMIAAAAGLFDRFSVPVTAPMETIEDPELQRVLLQLRAATGTRIVPLVGAQRELRAALARGEAVGLVADRDIGGGGLAVPLFGRPARLPIGAAWLALEHGAPLHVGTVRRAPGGKFRAALATVPHPPADLPRRARLEALLAAEARAFEDLIATSPEQWWTVFFPIWEDVGPRPRSAR
jgi:KDO2-lipid IV(A) lauroyltransferase